MKFSNIFVLSLVALLTTTCLWAQSPDRSAPPKSEKPKNLQLPSIQNFRLSNGVRVVMMEKRNVPLVQVNLIIQTGPFHDPAGKEGLADFALDLMDEGADTLNALKLADEIDYLGASINTSAQQFRSTIACSTPASKLKESLALMSLIALKPLFSQEEIERKKKEWLNELLQEFDDPGIIAEKAFNKYLFGNKSAYGKSASEKSVRSFSREDLVNFHKMNFVAGNTSIIVVGDVSKDEITALLEKFFSSYSSAMMKRPGNSIPEQYKSRKILIVNKPEAAQSVIMIGAIGADRATPDYNAIQVFNTIFGGSFTSRLNTNLRETHGYSYGAFSHFDFWPVPGPFTASSSVQTDATGPALKEFFNEFDAITKKMPTDEFERGKNYQALRYAGGFSTLEAIAVKLYEYVANSLPDDYFNTYVDKTLAVSQLSTEEATRKYILPDKFLVVIVGDASKIEAEVNKQKLGKATVVSIEDVLGKKPKVN
ncbi:MAG: pitrilysin family protein [Chryseolinea sp.]